MEKHVDMQFSNEILYEAARRFGISENSLKLLGAFENYVYEGEIDGTSYILRLTHSSHRSTNMVLGELVWINYLAENGVSVAKALPSLNRNLVEEIFVDTDFFIVSMFEKAKGALLNRNNPDNLKKEIIVEWGRVIGKMHRATKNYVVPNEDMKRYQWNEEDLNSFEKYIPKEKQHIIDIGNNLLEHFYTLPKTKDSYGLIHTDVHLGNFFINEGKITVFDFDDCSYQWFISDIAIALYYTIWTICNDYTEEAKEVFARNFMNSFMEGYNQKNKLDEFWLEEISYILKLRDLTIYTVLHKKLDINNLDEKYETLLNSIGTRIERGIPIVQI